MVIDMEKKRRIYRRASRYREFLKLIFAKYDVKCYFCGEPLTEKDIPVRRVDNITIHHKNHDRSDNRVENLVFAHRKCHKAYHIRQNNNKIGGGDIIERV